MPPKWTLESTELLLLGILEFEGITDVNAEAISENWPKDQPYVPTAAEIKARIFGLRQSFRLMSAASSTGNTTAPANNHAKKLTPDSATSDGAPKSTRKRERSNTAGDNVKIGSPDRAIVDFGAEVDDHYLFVEEISVSKGEDNEQKDQSGLAKDILPGTVVEEGTELSAAFQGSEIVEAEGMDLQKKRYQPKRVKRGSAATAKGVEKDSTGQEEIVPKEGKRRKRYSKNVDEPKALTTFTDENGIEYDVY